MRNNSQGTNTGAGREAHVGLTFDCDLFDLLGFLVNPFLPPDLLLDTHQLLQLLDLLSRGKEAG